MMIRAIALSLPLLAAGLAHAGGGGIAGGGATEITQLANKAQLIAQVGEASRQTATQLAQLNSMIKNLNPLQALNVLQSGAAGDIGRIVAASVKSADDAQRVFSIMQGMQRDASSLSGTAWSAYAMMRPVLQSMERNKIGFGESGKPMDAAQVHKSLNEALSKIPEAERRAIFSYDGQILSSQQYLNVLNERLNGVSGGMNNLLNQSNQISGISGNLQGLQFIAAQNVGIQASIKELTNTIIQMEMLREQRESERLSREAVRDMERKRRLQENYNNMRIGI